MKTTTITINVPYNFNDMEIKDIVRQCQAIVDPNSIAIFWSIEDVQEVARHLTDDQAREVLDAVKRRHDATIGINWDVLETVADALFDAPDEDE
jgi:hypothetical protein